jgi:hypothetical protein
MSRPPTVGFTRKRLLAGAAILVVASAIMLAAGVDPTSYFTGVALGMVIVGVMGWIAMRRQKLPR